MTDEHEGSAQQAHYELVTGPGYSHVTALCTRCATEKATTTIPARNGSQDAACAACERREANRAIAYAGKAADPFTHTDEWAAAYMRAIHNPGLDLKCGCPIVFDDELTMTPFQVHRYDCKERQ